MIVARDAGSSGTIQVGDSGVVGMNNLYCTNNSTLRFVAGLTSAGTIAVKNTLGIGPDAKLEVNMTNFAAKTTPTRLTLASYGSMPTKFSAGNITVTGLRQWDIDQVTDNKITLLVKVAGSVVLVR